LYTYSRALFTLEKNPYSLFFGRNVSYVRKTLREKFISKLVNSRQTFIFSFHLQTEYTQLLAERD